MRRKRLWLVAGAALLAGGALVLLLSTLTVHAVITSTVHTTVDDFNSGTFYLTGMTQQGDGEIALLRIGIAGGWITANVPSLPPVYGHAMVEHDGYVYVLGGKLTGGALTRTVFMSHINTATYMLEPFTTTTALPLSAYPNGVYMHSAVVVSDHLYIIGGDIDGSNVPTRTVMVATFNADGTLGQWQSAPSLPDLRSRVPAVALNGYIYVPGGKDDVGGGSAATGSVLYAPVDSNGLITGWMTATASLPYSPQGQMAAAYNGRIYVMGGFDSGAYAVQPYVYFATPSTTTGNIAAGGWVSTTSMQRSIMGGVALAFNGELFVLGGVESFGGNPIGYARSALLDIESGHVITFALGQGWYDSPALSPDRVWHAGVTSHDYRYIYVLGGTGGSLNLPLAEGILNRGSTTGVGGGSGYARSGWYVGPTIDLGLDRKILGFNWTTEIPSTAVTLTMQYRTQDLASNWSDWSAPIPPNGASGLITTTVPFTSESRAFRFQYRASLTTTAPLSYTPYLHHFELVYDVPQPPQFQKQAVPSTGSAVLRGQRITYTISFSNPNDLSPLRNVLITDTLPAYLEYVPGSITATAGITSDVSGLPELRWLVGTLATQTGGQVSFAAVVSGAAPIDAWLVNRARFWSSDTGSMDSTTSHLVAALKSPVLTKTALPADGAFVLAGQTLSYTLAYSNPNNALPLEMTMTDSLPISVSLVPGSCLSPTCTLVGNELRWQFTLPPLTQGQVGFAAVIASGAVSGTVIANTGYAVGCVAAAGVCSDNIASNPVTHRVVSLMPPVLRKDADPPSGATVLGDSLITYTLAFTNPNVSDALTAVVIRDALPANTSFVTCTGGCSSSAGVVTWTFSSLAPGASGQVQVTVRINSSTLDSTTIQNQASIISEQGRANSNPVTHHVLVPYDLQLTLTSNVTATLPGSSFIYTFAYTNAGPLTLTGVVITSYIGYALPGQASAPAAPYLTLPSASPGWQLAQSSAAGADYRYDMGTLGPNQAGALTMSVRLSATVPYTVNLLSHRAIIADDGAQGYEANPFNQSPQVNIPIQGPDLVITDWRISPGPHGAGKVFTVTATIANQGLGNAFSWDALITPTLGNWFIVELYAKPSTFAQTGPPTGPHDHAGGFCDNEDMWTCMQDSRHWRYSFLGFGVLAGGLPLAPGHSIVVNLPISLTATDVYSLYLQVDTGFWNPPDPPYGRVLESNELNNFVSLGTVSTGSKVYLPLVMRH